MNYYQFLRERRFGSVAVVSDAAEGTAGKVDMEAHDRRHHPHGFDPEHDTCKFREELAKMDKADMLSPDEGNGGAKWDAKDRADAEEAAKVLKRVLGGVEVEFADKAYEGGGDTRKSISGIFTGTSADYANESRQGGVGDGPSLQKIGSGEGAQVYGWGLYGSTVRGVAEGYAKAGGTEWTWLDRKNGKDLETKTEKWAADEIRDNGSVKNAIRSLEKELAKGNAPEGTRDVLEELKAHGDEYDVRKVKSENIYEQTFFTDRAPGDESHLLKWYEPVGQENMNRVIEQGKKEDCWFSIKSFAPFKTGEQLYKGVSEALGSPKAASEFLARAGIDGVKYPVDSYGGKGIKDGDKVGWNYVSFRDDNIRVDHKWVDGEQRYFKNSQGEVVGEYDRATGKITLYPGAKVKDVVHEYAHGLWQFAEQEAKAGRGALLGKMREIAFSAPQGVKDAVRANYGSEGADVMLEECFAHELARRSDTAFAKAIETAEGRPWYRRAWKTIKDVWKGFADKAGFNNADTKGIEDMSPADAAEQILSQLAKGKHFGDVRHDGGGEGRRKAIIGQQGAAALGIGRHDEAEKMERDGASREEIWRKTGWWKGKDGKWRVEVPPMKMRSAGEIDAALRLGNNRTPLEELVRAPELFKAYPSLRDMTVVFDPEYDRSSGGWYDVDAKEIHITHAGLKTMGKKTKRDWDEHTRNQKIVESDDYLRRRLSNMDALGLEHGTFEEEREKAKEWLAGESARLEKDNEGMVRHMAEGPVIIEKLRHEIQHAIQDSEVFATGGMVNDRNYERIAGEVEARNSARRENMTPEERAETPPWETEDVSEEKQIVIYN